MSVYKRGKVWWYSFTFEGKRLQASTKQRKEENAKNVEAKVRSSLAEQRVGLVRPDPVPTLSEYAPRFINYIERHANGKPRTVRFWKDKLKLLLAYQPLAKAPLDQIGESVIQDYITSRFEGAKRKKKKLAPATVNRELATLRRLLHRAKREKRIKSVLVITMLPGERERTFVLSQKQQLDFGGAPLLVEGFGWRIGP